MPIYATIQPSVTLIRPIIAVRPILFPFLFFRRPIIVINSRPSGNTQNFSAPSVTNSVTTNVTATGGSRVNVNVNQTTTINNSPTITPPSRVQDAAVYVSPVYHGSNYVRPLSINLTGNFGTIINKR